MDAEIWGIIGTVVGTMLGFTLNEVAVWRRERSEKKEQAKKVRLMVTLEIDRNLDLLQEFWEVVNQEDLTKKSETQAYIQLAEQFAVSPLPHWSHAIWQSEIPMLPLALNEKEVRAVHRLYTNFDMIESIHSSLSVLELDRQEERRATKGKESIGLRSFVTPKFYKLAPEIWLQCEKVINEIIQQGNPLVGGSK